MKGKTELKNVFDMADLMYNISDIPIKIPNNCTCLYTVLLLFILLQNYH